MTPPRGTAVPDLALHLASADVETWRTVTFAGRSERSAPLTWGQRAIHAAIRWLGDDACYFNLTRVVPVPSGVTVDRALDAVAALLVRHEGLRTVLQELADGSWQQHVRGAGSLALPVVRPRPGGEAPARELVDRLAQHTFRHDRELPLLVGIVLDDARPSHVVLAVSHLAADGWAADLLVTDLARLLDGTADAGPAWQPVDQARHESTGQGAARGLAAVDHWRRTVRTVPRDLFPRVDRGERTARYVRVRLTSTALAVASTVVAARSGVSTGTVLLASAAIVLGRLVGRDEVPFQLIASNRLTERNRALVGPLAENALCVVDVAPARGAGGFDRVARGAFAAGLNAYRHGQYDPDAVARVLEEERARGGGELNLGCFFNDMRIGRSWGAGPDAPGDASPDAVRALRSRSTLSVTGTWDRQDATYFVSVGDWGGTCGLQLMADTALVPRERIDALLREMEEVVVDAVSTAADADAPS